MPVIRAIGEKLNQTQAQSVLVPINLAGKILCPDIPVDLYADQLEQAMSIVQQRQATVGDILTLDRKLGEEKKKWVHIAIVAHENETHPSILAAIFMVLIEHVRDLEISSCAVPDLSSIPGSLRKEEVKLRLDAYLECYGMRTRFVLY